jgi:hypothetical protein
MSQTNLGVAPGDGFEKHEQPPPPTPPPIRRRFSISVSCGSAAIGIQLYNSLPFWLQRRPCGEAPSIRPGVPLLWDSLSIGTLVCIRCHEGTTVRIPWEWRMVGPRILPQQVKADRIQHSNPNQPRNRTLGCLEVTYLGVHITGNTNGNLFCGGCPGLELTLWPFSDHASWGLPGAPMSHATLPPRVMAQPEDILVNMKASDQLERRPRNSVSSGAGPFQV